MVNTNFRVVKLTVYCLGIYILLSIADLLFTFPNNVFAKVNLLSNIVQLPANQLVIEKKEIVAPIEIIPLQKKNFNLYLQKGKITSFNSDTNTTSIKSFIEKIASLKSGKKKRKIRIAYLGDSLIEGDLLTQTFRRLLQSEFGGSGVGFVPITSQVALYRQSVAATYSSHWQDNSFKTKGNQSALYLSGHQFFGPNEWVKMSDHVIKDTAALIEKTLLCGHSSNPLTLTINKSPTIIHADKRFNRIVLRKDKSKEIEVQFGNQNVPIYGISFESEAGIFVDNFSFRGISGIEYKHIDPNFLQLIQQENPYDLIVLQFGINVMYKPETTNFSYYATSFEPVIKSFKKSFPEADLLVMGCTDRAFRYNSVYSTAIGIDSLIKLQAALAYKAEANFYNQYATMGGKNALVKWVEQTPPLANKDYIHPNIRGAEELGKLLFNAVMKEYNKFTTTSL